MHLLVFSTVELVVLGCGFVGVCVCVCVCVCERERERERESGFELASCCEGGDPALL